MRNVHLNPEEAVEMAHNFGAKLAIAMHWGTIRLSDEPAIEPKKNG